MRKVFLENRTVERTDDFNVKLRRFFEQRLSLRAEFADYADVVSPCLAVPVLLGVKRAEFAESVCGKKHLVLAVIACHNLRPMNHRSKDKGQRMGAEGERFAVLNGNLFVFERERKIIFHHCKGLCVGNDFCVRKSFNKFFNACRMIRLHMVNDKIVGSFSSRCGLDVLNPFIAESAVNAVRNGNFFVKDHIGIICHSVRHDVLTFKKINFMIIHADISYIICNSGHFKNPPAFIL